MSKTKDENAPGSAGHQPPSLRCFGSSAFKVMKEKQLSLLTLFTSTGTLICCALPALLVTFGFGGALASFLSSVPWLVWLSRHKILVFAISAIFLFFTSFLIYFRTKAQTTCNATSNACQVADKFKRATLWLSLVIYFVGFFMSFLYLPVLLYLERQ